MQRGRPSLTALHIALARSWLTRAGIIDDPYAHGFLDRGHAYIERALWWGRWSHLGERSFAYIAARTRFYDTLIDSCLDAGTNQVVLLAAGYDSRAWRLARPGVRFFDVDHPDTQTRKRGLAPTTDGPTYVAADLGSVPLDQPLLAAGFQSKHPSVFCCEGLTMYLPEAAIRTLLGAVAGLAAAGSRLGVDFASAVSTSTPTQRAVQAASRAIVRSSGERIQFALAPTAAPAFLADTGWEANQVLIGPELHDRFLDPHELPLRWTAGASFAATATIPA